MLEDEAERWKIVRKELKEIARAYGDDRRTKLLEGPLPTTEYREEDYIIDEDSWVIVTREGWIKRQKSFSDVPSIRVRDEDVVGWVYRARARQTLTLFTDRGVAYTLRVNDVPLTTGHGEPVQKLFAFDDNEHIVGVVCHDPRCLPDVKNAPPPTQPIQAVLARTTSSCAATATAMCRPRCRPPPYAVALTAGGKVLRFSLSAVGGRLDAQGPAGRAARPGWSRTIGSWGSRPATARRTSAWRRGRPAS